MSRNALFTLFIIVALVIAIFAVMATLPIGFIFRDNITGHGTYGVHGLTDIRSTDAQRLFENNVIVNNKQVDESDTSFPGNNLWVTDVRAVGFANVQQNDYKLVNASKFKGRGTKKNDIGCDVSQLPIDELKAFLN
jgi:hypothetical protein